MIKSKVNRNKPTPGKRTTPGKPTIQLAAEASVPITELGQAKFLIHGERGIGKTSLCSRFPGAYFCMFEPGGTGLRIRQTRVQDWDTFRQMVPLLIDDRTIKTVIIDTVDMAYDRCYKWVCKKNVVNHPNEAEDFGGTWRDIYTELSETMNCIQDSGKGLIFTSHTETREMQRYAGGNYVKLVPSMAKQAFKYAAGEADVIGYYGYYGRDRFLTIEGDESLEAKNRLEEQFRVKGTDKPIHSIPMGRSSQEAYRNLIRAFENGQADRCEPEALTGLEVRAKRESRSRRR